MSAGVYVHTPFCVTKCTYCDFFSGVFDSSQTAPFIAALEREIALRAAELAECQVASIFVGGGTPTFLETGELERVFTALREHFELATDVEITVEANPESLTDDKARALRAMGVDRVSVGVQSLNDAVLHALGRPHDSRQALAAARRARQLFPRASADLIVAVPGMTAELLDASLTPLLELGLDHLSAYQLTVEPGTAFATSQARGELVEMDDEGALELDALVTRRTEAAGLARYEVSNYARPGAECRHHLEIWRGGFYLGVGPGAHSFLPPRPGAAVSAAPPAAARSVASPCLVERGVVGRRRANAGDLAGYLGAWRRGEDIPGSEEEIDAPMHLEERLLLGLRLTEGVRLEQLGAELGRGPAWWRGGRFAAAIERLGIGDFVRLEGDRLQATTAGRRLLDSVVAELVDAASCVWPVERPANARSARGTA